MNDSDIAVDNIFGDGVDVFEVDCDTCALCKYYYSHKHLDDYCKDCPLIKAGIASCEDDNSPFSLFLNEEQVSPMIKALRKALNQRKKK